MHGDGTVLGQRCRNEEFPCELLTGLTPGISGLTMDWDGCGRQDQENPDKLRVGTQVTRRGIPPAFPLIQGNGGAHYDDLTSTALTTRDVGPSLGYLGLYQYDHAIIKGDTASYA